MNRNLPYGSCFFYVHLSMQYKLGQCSECLKEGKNNSVFIVNRTHKLCQYHNRVRLNNQREVKKSYNNRSSKTFAFNRCWGYKTEIEMFTDIWRDRAHVSEITGLPVQFSPITFMHILAKGLNKYPHYRFNPANIMLGTPEEHHLIDAGTEDQRKSYAKKYPRALQGFRILNEKKETLLRSYREEFP